MASGKSRTGRALAERLGRPYIDTDAVIVERAGKSITDIFAQDGEAAFRQMEKDLITEIAQDQTPKVVSLGGGALNQPGNLKRSPQAHNAKQIKSKTHPVRILFFLNTSCCRGRHRAFAQCLFHQIADGIGPD